MIPGTQSRRRRQRAAGLLCQLGLARTGGAVKRFALLPAMALVVALWGPAAEAAGPAPAGATACSGCHGPVSGPSVGPSITGRAASETAAIMEEFRTGARAGTVMPRIAKGFTAEETRAIADWWAAVRPEATP